MWFLPCIVAILAPGGCGDASGGRCAVSGKVYFKSRPLDQGNITFIPAGGKIATQSGASIQNGVYSIPKMKGLVPGRYRVAISSGDRVTPAGPSDQPPGPSGNFSSRERIPQDFNVESTREIVVKKDGPNEFDFDIP
jgi:hypothetical protein